MLHPPDYTETARRRHTLTSDPPPRSMAVFCSLDGPGDVAAPASDTPRFMVLSLTQLKTIVQRLRGGRCPPPFSRRTAQRPKAEGRQTTPALRLEDEDGGFRAEARAC